jgi:DNA-binding FadR family transcriptional regulator
VQAIAAHDPAAARHAMRAHLERVTRTLSRG